MSERRLLLIDNDPGFRRTLNEHLAPYGFEIHLADQGSADALGHVRDLRPAIIFIAVEEPDKLGYSLCNKAKKGVAANIPVVLTTKTVPKKGFLSHKKLKVHADEYIDKRSMTREELIEKVDQLIGLGEGGAAQPRLSEELEIPMEVEEVSLDDDLSAAPEDMVVDEIEAGDEDDFDGGERTSIAPPSLLVDSAVDNETDAAFAALTSDPAIELSELDIEEPSLPEPPPVSTRAPSSPPVAVKPDPKPDPKPEPKPAPPKAAELAPLPVEAEVEDSGGVPAPIADSDAAPDLGLDAVVEMAVEEASGVTDRKSLLKIHQLEKDNARLKSELEHAKASAPAAGEGSYSREREFLNLREVINKKEREVLNLQDELGSKERFILDGKDKIRQLEHSKASADSKNLELEQRILEQMESRTAIERDKNAASARAEQLTGRVNALDAELAQLRQQSSSEIEGLRRQVSSDAETAARALADAQAAHSAATQQLEGERAAAVSQAEAAARSQVADAERARDAAVAELRTRLEAERDAAVEAMRQERDTAVAGLRQERDAAVEALRQEHADEQARLVAAHVATVEAKENDHGSALAALVKQHDDDRTALEQARDAAVAEAAERHRRELGERDAARKTDLQKLEDQHAGQLVRIEREKTAGVAAAVADKDQAVAAAVADKEQAVAAAAADKEQAQAAAAADKHQAISALEASHGETITSLVTSHEQTLDETTRNAEQRLRASLASAADERAAAENALQERFESEKHALEKAHAEVVATLEDQRSGLERGLSGARADIARLEGGVADRDGRITAAEQAIAAHLAAIEDRDAKLATLKREIAELEEQNAAYQEQILKAYQKIKTDEATNVRAKKAIAIALTLLDDQVNAKAEGKKD